MEIAIKDNCVFIFCVYSGDFVLIFKWLNEYLAFKDILKLHVFYHALNVICLKGNMFLTLTLNEILSNLARKSGDRKLVQCMLFLYVDILLFCG